jgi:hypothetical protein
VTLLIARPDFTFDGSNNLNRSLEQGFDGQLADDESKLALGRDENDAVNFLQEESIPLRFTVGSNRVVQAGGVLGLSICEVLIAETFRIDAELLSPSVWIY